MAKTVTIAMANAQATLHERRQQREFDGAVRADRLPPMADERPSGPAAIEASSAPAQQHRWKRDLQFVQRAATMTGKIASMGGARALGSALQSFGGAAGQAQDSQEDQEQNDGAGFARRFGANTIGRKAATAAQLRGMGGGAAAVGGAVAALAAGQMKPQEVALNAGRWYARKIAFAALLDPEPIGQISALAYLNTDFLQSEFFSSNEMASFFLLEKIWLAIANFVVLAIILGIIAIIYIIIDPCVLASTPLKAGATVLDAMTRIANPLGGTVPCSALPSVP